MINGNGGIINAWNLGCTLHPVPYFIAGTARRGQPVRERTLLTIHHIPYQGSSAVHSARKRRLP